MASRPSALVLIALAACGSEQAPTATSASAPASAMASATLSAAMPAAPPTATSSASVVSTVNTVSSAAAPGVVPEGMVEIPEAFFLLGSPNGQGNPEEHPMTERAVPRLYMDATEVTAGAYAKCVAAGACAATKQDDQFCTAFMKDHDDHPINCVDHKGATDYCAWVKKRLPTEGEWEHAAASDKQNRFSWGSADPTTHTACYSHPGGTCKVASFPAGEYGLFDMSGNVWEWTDSWFAMLPAEPTEGARKIFKGGSWSRRWPKWLRVKNRSHWQPEKSNSWLGFRCVQSKHPIVCPAEAEPAGEGCKRTSGSPLCEPHYGWNGKACTPIGTDGKPMAEAPKSEAKPGEQPSPDQPISVARTPGDDGDCQKNYPHKPNAYRWTGNTWEARIKLVAAKGCTRRDNAPIWVSACCPN
jgi:formylglycine-generating enzyme required for sulfatase activity